MDLSDFMGLLERLDADAIAAAASELDAYAASAAGELSWWRATVEIDRELRLHRAGRVAALSATQAAAAVTQAAVAAGITLPDARVTVVARAAADVARGLAVHATAVDELLRGCRHLTAA